MSDKVFMNGLRFKMKPLDFFCLDMSLCYEDIITAMKENKEYARESKNGKHYFNLTIKEKREPDQYGITHYAEVDTWKPESQPNNAPSEPQSQPNVPEAVQQTFHEGNVVEDDEDIPF